MKILNKALILLLAVVTGLRGYASPIDTTVVIPSSVVLPSTTSIMLGAPLSKERLWYSWYANHSGNAKDASKIVSYLTSISDLRYDSKFLSYLAGKTQAELDDIVTKMHGAPSGAGPALSQKEVIDKIKYFLNSGELPANTTKADHFLVSFGTNTYYSRHNVEMMEDIATVNANSGNLIKTADNINFNIDLPNANGSPSKSYPDLYIKKGNDIYIYEKKAGNIDVENPQRNFTTQAGAYLKDQEISKIRWSIDDMPSQQQVVDAWYNGGIFDDAAVRFKFEIHFSGQSFPDANTLKTFIENPSNNSWYITMFKNNQTIGF